MKFTGGNINDRTKKFKYNRYDSRDYVIESSSGMDETIHSEYLGGMHNVLGIDDHSRFINLLTVLRSHKKEFSKNGPNKRCQC